MTQLLPITLLHTFVTHLCYTPLLHAFVTQCHACHAPLLHVLVMSVCLILFLNVLCHMLHAIGLLHSLHISWETHLLHSCFAVDTQLLHLKIWMLS